MEINAKVLFYKTQVVNRSANCITEEKAGVNGDKFAAEVENHTELCNISEKKDVYDDKVECSDVQIRWRTALKLLTQKKRECICR